MHLWGGLFVDVAESGESEREREFGGGRASSSRRSLTTGCSFSINIKSWRRLRCRR